VTVELIDENGELLPPGEIDLVVKAPKLTVPLVGKTKVADKFDVTL
jgi:hypothetical protein